MQKKMVTHHGEPMCLKMPDVPRPLPHMKHRRMGGVHASLYSWAMDKSHIWKAITFLRFADKISCVAVFAFIFLFTFLFIFGATPYFFLLIWVCKSDIIIKEEEDKLRYLFFIFFLLWTPPPNKNVNISQRFTTCLCVLIEAKLTGKLAEANQIFSIAVF